MTRLRKEFIRWYVKTPHVSKIVIPDISYRDLAKLTGIDHTLLQKVFTGKRILPQNTATQWKDKFDKIRFN